MEEIIAKIKRLDLTPAQIKITLDEPHPSATIIASLTIRKRGAERKLIIGEYTAKPDEHLLAKAIYGSAKSKPAKPSKPFSKSTKSNPNIFGGTSSSHSSH